MNADPELFNTLPHRVSLADVAAKANVSKATVCRALRGRGRISEATRIRIREIAQEIGYTTDPALSALTRYRWGDRVAGRSLYSVALVSVNPYGQGKSAYFSLRQSGLNERAKELNLIVEYHAIDNKTTTKALSRMLFARGIDGVIFHISGPIFEWDFAWEKFACVTLGFGNYDSRQNSVTSDWFSAQCSLAEHVRTAGYTKIGFANFYRGNPLTDNRVLAATLMEVEAHKKLFGPQPKVFWYPKDKNLNKDIFAAERDNFLRWFEKEQPDAVIDGNTMACYWLQDAGVKLGQEVGYASINAFPQEHPHISGAVHQRERQGRLAIDMLLSLIQMNERGMSKSPLRLSTACDWHEGTTLPPKKAARPSKKAKA